MMPKVFFGKEVYEVENALYEWFLDELLIEERPMAAVLLSMKPKHAESIGKYIAYRLAEVDPGYAPNYGYLVGD